MNDPQPETFCILNLRFEKVKKSLHFCVNSAVPSLKVSSTHPLTRRLTFPFECIGGVVDEAAQDHLYELEGGDQHGHTPRHSQPDSSSDQQPGGRYSPDGLEEVVGVHQRVHEEVHDDEPAGWSRVLAEGVPAVDEDGDVVIPVEEYQLLFPQHDEDGVSQLGDLHTASETSLVFHVLTHLQDKFRVI